MEKMNYGKRLSRRLLVAVLAIAMLVTFMPSMAFADPGDPPIEVEVDLSSTDYIPTEKIQDAIDNNTDVVIKLTGGTSKTYSGLGHYYGEEETPGPGLDGPIPTYELTSSLSVPLGKNITIKSEQQVVIRAKEDSRHIVVASGTATDPTSITFANVVLYGVDDWSRGSGDTGGIKFDGSGTSTLTLDGAFITQCGYRSGSGAGVYSDGNLILKNSIIYMNMVQNGNGGGVYSTTDVDVIDSLFFFNHARSFSSSRNDTAGNGAGIYSKSGDVTIKDNSLITTNLAQYDGGGIYANGDTVTVNSGSKISDNDAKTHGGGIYAPKGDIDIESASIIHNHASDGNGGGIYTEEGNVNIKDSIISKNDAKDADGMGTFCGDGGGVFSLDGSTTVENSQITDNIAEYWGGGIYNYNDSGNGTLKIKDSIITGNNAHSGGGIQIDGDTTIEGNTVIKDNTATYSSAICSYFEIGVDITLSIENTYLIEGGVGESWEDEDYFYAGLIDMTGTPSDKLITLAPRITRPDNISIKRTHYKAPDGTVDGATYDDVTSDFYSYDKDTGTITLKADALETVVENGTLWAGDYIFEISIGSGKILEYRVTIKGDDVPYTVKYLEQGTTDVEVAPTKTVKNQKIGSTVYESAIYVAGYTHAAEPNAKSLKLDSYNQEIVFYYVVNTYTVTFDTDGGSAAPSPVDAKYNTALGTNFPSEPTKADYTFDGWFTNNGVEFTDATPVTKNITVKAKWTSITEEEAAALAKAKTEAKDELSDYGILTDYRPAELASVLNERAIGRKNINKATSIDEVEKALAAAKAAIDAIKTDAQLTAEEKNKPPVDSSKVTTTEGGITTAPNVVKIRTPLKTVYLTKNKTYKIPYVLDTVGGKPIKDPGVKFTASKAKIVKFINSGSTHKIKALKAGKTVITIKAQNGKKAKIKVVVQKKKVTLKKFKVKVPKKLKVGKTYQLKIKKLTKKATNISKVTFKSSSKKIAKVDKAGKITALKKGTVEITIKVGKKKLVKTIAIK